MRSLKLLAVAAVGAGALFAGAAQAAVLYHPTVVSASSSYPGYGASDAVDSDPTTDWASNGDGDSAYIIFDLGSDYSLGTAVITDRVTSGSSNGSAVYGNYDYTTGFSLTACADAACTTGTLINTTTKPLPSSPADFTSTVDLTGITTEFLKYSVTSHNAPLGTNNTGLSEFAVTASTPEPASWLLMIAGLGVTGAMLRTRRRNGFVAA